LSRPLACGSLPDRLGHDPDRPPDPVGLARTVVAGHGGVAGVRPGQGGQHLDGGGLAGAVRAEQAEHLARRDRQGETVEGAYARRVGLDEVTRLDMHSQISLWL
jgi:hypothetical protein